MAMPHSWYEDSSPRRTLYMSREYSSLSVSPPSATERLPNPRTSSLDKTWRKNAGDATSPVSGLTVV